MISERKIADLSKRKYFQDKIMRQKSAARSPSECKDFGKN
jgi:hypothetical protein